MYKDLDGINEDVVNVDAIRNSLRNILSTPRGSVPGKPDFGCDLYKIIFQPIDPLTESMAKKFVSESVRKFENRVDLQTINIKKDEAFNKIVIDIVFTYKTIDLDDEGNNEPQTLSLAINV